MGRTPCCKEDGLKKGAWTADEDRKLTAYIREHGEGGWRTLPQKAGLQRCGKSCRLRWANYLRPDIKRGKFSSEEEQKIIELHATLGSRWSAIARHLPMRTDNEIKNYWNTYIKKRLTKMGVDPVTHKPIDPSVDNTHEHDSNNLATSPGPRCDDDEIAARPLTPSGPPSAGSARLLNRLATKLALSRCLDNFKSCQSRHDKDVTDHKESTSVAAPGGVACDADQHLLTIPRPVSSSARLLNKIASRVTTTSFHSLDSILSKPIEGGDSYGPGRCGGGGFDGDSRSNNYWTPRSTSTSSLSESTGAASDLSRSISYSSGAPEETMAKHLAPLDDDDNDDDPFDLELLKHWEGVLTGSIDDADTDVIGCCSDGGVSSTATGDTYNIDSPMYPLKSSTASGYDSRELSDLLCSCLDGS